LPVAVISPAVATLPPVTLPVAVTAPGAVNTPLAPKVQIVLVFPESD
jgi:hypothetical protein